MTKILSLMVLLVSLNSICVGQDNSCRVPYPFDLQDLATLSYNLTQDDSIVPVKLEGGFGYINTKSKLPVFKQRFELAYPFEHNFGLVKVDGRYGIIDRNAEFVVKPTFYSYTLSWDENWGIFFGDKDFFSFSEGRIPGTIHFSEPTGPELFPYKKGAKFGLTFKGDTTVKPVFDSVYANTNRIAVVNRAGKIFIVDRTGKALQALDYDQYVGPTGWDPYRAYSIEFALRHKHKWHYFRGAKKIFENKLQPALSGGVFLVRIKKRYNILNERGDLILSKNYEWISNNGAIAINENDNVVFLLKGGQELIYY